MCRRRPFRISKTIGSPVRTGSRCKVLRSYVAWLLVRIRSSESEGLERPTSFKLPLGAFCQEY